MYKFVPAWPLRAFRNKCTFINFKNDYLRTAWGNSLSLMRPFWTIYTSSFHYFENHGGMKLNPILHGLWEIR